MMETEDEFLDSFTERYRHYDFLYAKNDQYKMTDLEFEKDDPPYLLIDILIFELKNQKTILKQSTMENLVRFI